jgi:hypothetical protein
MLSEKAECLAESAADILEPLQVHCMATGSNCFIFVFPQ